MSEWALSAEFVEDVGVTCCVIQFIMFHFWVLVGFWFVFFYLFILVLVLFVVLVFFFFFFGGYFCCYYF